MVFQTHQAFKYQELTKFYREVQASSRYKTDLSEKHKISNTSGKKGKSIRTL